MNDFATFDMLPFIPLHFLCTHFWHLVHCNYLTVNAIKYPAYKICARSPIKLLVHVLPNPQTSYKSITLVVACYETNKWQWKQTRVFFLPKMAEVMIVISAMEIQAYVFVSLFDEGVIHLCWLTRTVRMSMSLYTHLIVAWPRLLESFWMPNYLHMTLTKPRETFGRQKGKSAAKTHQGFAIWFCFSLKAKYVFKITFLDEPELASLNSSIHKLGLVIYRWTPVGRIIAPLCWPFSANASITFME